MANDHDNKGKITKFKDLYIHVHNKPGICIFIISGRQSEARIIINSISNLVRVREAGSEEPGFEVVQSQGCQQNLSGKENQTRLFFSRATRAACIGNFVVSGRGI